MLGEKQSEKHSRRNGALDKSRIDPEQRVVTSGVTARTLPGRFLIPPSSFAVRLSLASTLTSFYHSTMSSILSTRRQRLPNETLTNILLEMDPWDVWPLRRVSHNFNSYIMRYLAPRKYLPMTSIFVRAEDSWIFVGANRDLVTPSTPGDPADSPEHEEGIPTSLTSPFGAHNDHRGRKLAFLATRVPPRPVPRIGPSFVAQPIAEFLPAVEAERDIIQMKLYDPVQVIIRVGTKFFRHVSLPTLVVDRESLIMSLDWRELFNAVLYMPENIRRLKDAQAWPSKLWIPDAFVWVDRPDSDYDSDEDSDMSVSEPSGSELLVGGEEGVHVEEHASEGGEIELPAPVEAVEDIAPASPLPIPTLTASPVPTLAPALPVAPPLAEELDEPEALTELMEVLPEPEGEHVGGFSRDELEEHAASSSSSASEGGAFTYGPTSYGEGFTTAEEALREAFVPSYALLLDYEESSSEGGRSDPDARDAREVFGDDAPSIGVTSDEYVARSSREGAVASSFSYPPAEGPSSPVSPPHARPAPVSTGEAGSSELTPPSGSGGAPSPHERSRAPLHAAGESFLVMEDTSAENTSSDSAGLATTGHVTYRSVGVQVQPFMLSASQSTTLTRHHSWP